eukprot:TRINITY_DN10350_c0_g2_i1.p1 TRINITY_DN10350_c0_g2~~TRINITY_DN10350_c0_g2_i1.p1  ORF type:complete len:1116 (-),score=215.93 TRINITY_DN10350_c0_g2_i1:80-3346(-)
MAGDAAAGVSAARRSRRLVLRTTKDPLTQSEAAAPTASAPASTKPVPSVHVPYVSPPVANASPPSAPGSIPPGLSPVSPAAVASTLATTPRELRPSTPPASTPADASAAVEAEDTSSRPFRRLRKPTEPDEPPQSTRQLRPAPQEDSPPRPAKRLRRACRADSPPQPGKQLQAATKADSSRQPVKGQKASKTDSSRQPVKGQKASKTDSSRQPVKGQKASKIDSSRQPVKGQKASKIDSSRQPVKGQKASKTGQQLRQSRASRRNEFVVVPIVVASEAVSVPPSESAQDRMQDMFGDSDDSDKAEDGKCQDKQGVEVERQDDCVARDDNKLARKAGDKDVVGESNSRQPKNVECRESASDSDDDCDTKKTTSSDEETGDESSDDNGDCTDEESADENTKLEETNTRGGSVGRCGGVAGGALGGCLPSQTGPATPVATRRLGSDEIQEGWLQEFHPQFGEAFSQEDAADAGPAAMTCAVKATVSPEGLNEQAGCSSDGGAAVEQAEENSPLAFEEAASVELSGFSRSDLDGRYYKVDDELIHGNPTYWKVDKGFCIYQQDKRWTVCDSGSIAAVRAGQVAGWAFRMDMEHLCQANGWNENTPAGEWKEADVRVTFRSSWRHPPQYEESLRPELAETIEFGGFSQDALNTRYHLRLDKEIQGRPSYWDDWGAMFVYWQKELARWAVCDLKGLDAAHSGLCPGWAYRVDSNFPATASGWMEPTDDGNWVPALAHTTVYNAHSNGLRLQLSGLMNMPLNGRYHERQRVQVNGKSTFWSQVGEYFVYWQASERRWAIAGQQCLQATDCNPGWAYRLDSLHVANSAAGSTPSSSSSARVSKWAEHVEEQWVSAEVTCEVLAGTPPTEAVALLGSLEVVPKPRGEPGRRNHDRERRNTPNSAKVPKAKVAEKLPPSKDGGTRDRERLLRRKLHAKILSTLRNGADPGVIPKLADDVCEEIDSGELGTPLEATANALRQFRTLFADSSVDKGMRQGVFYTFNEVCFIKQGDEALLRSGLKFLRSMDRVRLEEDERKLYTRFLEKPNPGSNETSAIWQAADGLRREEARKWHESLREWVAVISLNRLAPTSWEEGTG